MFDFRTMYDRREAVDSPPGGNDLEIIMAEKTILIASARRRHSCYEFLKCIEAGNRM